jgi:hypothetical protein
MGRTQLTRMRTRAPGVIVAAAIVLAGCGGNGGGTAGPDGAAGSAAARPADTRSAATIVSQLKAAMGHASSVHLAGQLRSRGTDVDLNVSLIRSGAFSGLITSGTTKLDIVAAGDDVYVKVTSAFLKLAHAPAAACSHACGKYVAEAASGAQAITGDFSMSSLLGNVTSELPSYQKAGTATIGGRQALALHGSDGSTLYVAATGTPFPLRAIAPKSSDAGELDFSLWNAVPPIAAPPAADVISLGQLIG